MNKPTNTHTNKQREILKLKNTMTEVNYSLELQKKT